MDLLIFFLIIVVLTSTATKLLNKYVVKNTEPYAFSLLTQIVSAAIFLVLAVWKFELPTQPIAWLILGIAAVLWSMVSVSVLISYKKTDVSLRDPLSQSKIIIAFILGALFLREAQTVFRIIGNLLVFLGVVVLVYHPKKRFGRLNDPGVKWTFLAALLSAVVAVVDKAALKYFNVETYGFLVFFIPMLILLLFIPSRIGQVQHLLKTKWKAAFAAILVSAASYYFFLKALSLEDFTLVYPLTQLATLLTVLGGIFIMKERDSVPQKIIATVLVIAGAIVLKL